MKPAAAQPGAKNHAFFDGESEERVTDRPAGDGCTGLRKWGREHSSRQVVRMHHLGVVEVARAARRRIEAWRKRLAFGEHFELAKAHQGLAAVNDRNCRGLVPRFHVKDRGRRLRKGRRVEAARDTDLEPFELAHRTRAQLNFQVDGFISKGEPGRSHQHASPRGRCICCSHRGTVALELDEGLAAERRRVAARRSGHAIKCQEARDTLSRFEPKPAVRFIDIQPPGPFAPEQTEIGTGALPGELLHAGNSKTPPTRIATNRRGRNREEAVRYERSRRFGRTESLSLEHSRSTAHKIILCDGKSRVHRLLLSFFRCIRTLRRERRQVGIAAAFSEDVQVERPDRLVLGQPETFQVPAGCRECGFAMGLAGQAVVLQLTARAVAPGRGDLVNRRGTAARRGAGRAITEQRFKRHGLAPRACPPVTGRGAAW